MQHDAVGEGGHHNAVCRGAQQLHAVGEGVQHKELGGGNSSSM